ncbi:auxin-responsive protein SAUR71-like [Triticum dicoccoides]|nr:auxin-responsive protein SAUR71-like [Triticum dicoccoides]XP_044429147.1 auxin-responsive protein SAUR71-like [Triticum aestivum]
MYKQPPWSSQYKRLLSSQLSVVPRKEPATAAAFRPPLPSIVVSGVDGSSSNMKRLLRRLSRVAAADACAAAAYQPLRPDAAAKASSSSFYGARRLGRGARVPEGHVPVCVGEEGGPIERFAVRAELLGQPAFKALLRRAAQEYGYGHPGALRIPCAVANFRRLLLGLSDPGCQATDDDDAAFYY